MTTVNVSEAPGLQEWAVAHDPSKSNLIFKDGFWDQIMFVRDKIPAIAYHIRSVATDDRSSAYELAQVIERSMRVISTHTSKSVKLPVFHIVLPNGDECVMRYNFYNWKVSVKANQPVIADFMDLFATADPIHSVYCEGFPSEWVFGSYNANQSQFTIEIGNEYKLFTFFWIYLHTILTKKT